MPSTSERTPGTIAIAGVTGFVGRALAARLAASGRRVIGLSRGAADPAALPGVELRHCDLFSLLQCEEALAGVDSACYLVHSMLPSAQLTQGGFQDMDLIMADNFARAAASAGVRRIVYLGGLVPDAPGLSAHLASRLEVERTLGSRGVPLAALRSGLIVGAGGSSFNMLVSLLRRLPLIPCPPWVATPSQPIALRDALALLEHCLERPDGGSRTCDIGGPDVLTYREMLERAARLLGLRRSFVDVPWRGELWRGRWLSLLTGAPVELARPLVESMALPMVCRDRRLQEEAGLPGLGFDEAVSTALAELRAGAPRPWGRPAPAGGPRHNVRSVQRLPLPPGRTARWAAERYARWLTVFFRRFIVAEAEGDTVRLLLRFPRVCLLELVFARDRSQAPDRQVFYIESGALARPNRTATQRPRLEFREALGGTCLLVAVHDYRPTLPWFVYNLTQAVIHPWAVRRFAGYLSRCESTSR